MRALIIFPVVLPLFAAAVSLLGWRSRLFQRAVALVLGVTHLASAAGLFWMVYQGGTVVFESGGWRAPFGILFVADLFSAVMVLVAAVIGLAVIVYSFGSIDEARERFGYYPLLSVLIAGVCGAFLTGDIFNLYVWFEVLLIASFVLISLGGEKAQMEGAIKYVCLNLISSALFLTAAGILYGIAGTLNFADLSLTLARHQNREVVTGLSMMFLVSFGIKAAVFPMFFWLPASYHTPPAPVSAIFAGLLTKVGVYALIRVFTLIFIDDAGFTHSLILWIAGLTMITGVLGAVAQNDMRRILSFHIVSQIGYMIMGLGLFTKQALAGAVFYIVHHIIVKTNLFLVSGVVLRMEGTTRLKELGGWQGRYPAMAALFLVPALSLAGLPPLSGFFAKLSLVKAGFDSESYAIIVVALVVGFLTLVSMMKIWNEVFWKPRPVEASASSGKPSFLLTLPIASLAAITLTMGFFAEPFYAVAGRVANELMDPRGYVTAVLGDRA